MHTFVRSDPVISETRNSVTFTIPGESDARTLDLSPAEVAIGDQLEVIGSDLKGDADTALLLNHSTFTDPVAADAAWSLDTSGSKLTATVQATASGQPILPGIYGAIVRTTDRRRLPDGSFRDFERFSNQVAFAIAPRIVDITIPVAEFVIQVQGFEPHLLTGDDVMLFVGQTRMVRTNAGPPGQGEFVTPNAPPVDTDKVVFRLPAGIASGTVLAVRLVVRSAESAPQWVTAP